MKPQGLHQKRQLNVPKDRTGKEMPVLLPGIYTLDELLSFAYRQGYEVPYSEKYDPLNMPYWRQWKTATGESEILVGISGIVAGQFPDRPDEWRVIEQQQDGPILIPRQTYSERDFAELSQAEQVRAYFALQRSVAAQRYHHYIKLYFPDNPQAVSTGHTLHSLVGHLFCEITEDSVYWDEEGNLQLDSRPQYDHLDKDKTNNSFFNLNRVSGELNQDMRNMKVEGKREILGSLTKFDRDLFV